MAEEVITIIRVDTGEAVRNISDLKNNIQEYKNALADLDIGSKEYNDVLNALQVNQAALKNAMYAATQEGTAQRISMEDVAKAAYGAGESYNALVKRMADLKREFRATEDETKRITLGRQIDEVNTKLKEMDALQGNYQRNVGNYKSALDGLSKGFQATAGSAGAIINPLKNMTTGLQALSATPALAVLGLLANALTKVGEGIKSDEENTNAWNRALAAFKPIGDAFTRSMQSIGAAAADLANKFVELLYQWGLLDEEAGRHRQAMADDNAYLRQLQRDIDLENANLEETISDLRAKAAERDKYAAEERLKMLEEATKWQMRIEQNNSKILEERLRLAKEEAALAKNDAATNDKINELEVAVIDQRTKRNTTIRRLNREMSAAKAEIARADAKAAKDTIAAENEVTENTIKSVDEVEKALARLEKALDGYSTYWGGVADETAAMLAESDAAMTEALQTELDAQLDAEYDAMMREREINQQRVQTFVAFASAIGNLAGSLADIYEADADADEAAAQKAKALKVAAAIINTIGGAVSAFTSTWGAAEIPLSAKMVLAPVNAAAVLAAGYAQVKQINAVKVGKGGSSGASVSAPTMPAFSTSIQQVRSVTGAAEEERLNQMAAKNRVYILASDLQAERDSTRVRVAETAF